MAWAACATAHAQAPAAVPGAREAPSTFQINAIDVSGVTKLTAAEVERIIYPHLGPGRSNDDVIAARKALQDAYAAKGFESVFVDVPIQPNELFAQGIVQIKVNETPVGRVRVVEAKHHSLTGVREDLPSLQEGQPIDFKALQQDIAAANRYPDRNISPSFNPGQVPGTIDVDLRVEDSSPFHASLELNNDSSPNTTPLRLSGTVRYSDLWQLGHTISATYAVAPERRSQSEVISASYNAPLIGTPWSVLIYGYKSNSDVAALGGTNVLGNGSQVGLRAIYRLPSTKSYQSLSVGIDFKSFDEQIFVLDQPIRPSPIRYVPLVFDYNLQHAGENDSLSLSAGATVGLRTVKRLTCVDPEQANVPDLTATCVVAAGGTVGLLEDQFQGRSLDARENFVHLNADLTYTRVLPQEFVGVLRIAGQFSDASLVTNEQFSIGGQTNVRGYYLSEAVGDDGFIESLELRSPSIAPLFGSFVDEARLFLFGDMGYARVRRPALGQDDDFRIAGIGGGGRVSVFKLLTGEFVVGVPLLDGPTSRTGDPRVNFLVRGEF